MEFDTTTSVLDMIETISIIITLLVSSLTLVQDFKFHVKIQFDKTPEQAAKTYWKNVNKTLTWTNLWLQVLVGVSLTVISLAIGGNAIAGIFTLAAIGIYVCIVKYNVSKGA